MNLPNYDEIGLNLRWGRRPYFDLSRQDNQKIKIRRKLEQFNTYLNTFGLGFKNIDICRMDAINNNNFKLNIEKEIPDLDKAEICQKARDQALMSERAYKRFKYNIKPIAKLSSLRKCNIFKSRLNNFWQIENNSFGAFIAEPLTKIKFVCERFLNILLIQFLIYILRKKSVF